MSESESYIRRRWPFFSAIVALSLMGCSRSQETQPSEATASATVKVTIVDLEGFDAVLERLRGQVVLVDFWATWCAPCIEQLPHTAALARELKDQGLAVITMSMDDPEGMESIRGLLARLGATGAINLVSRDGGGSREMEAFEIEGGALPYYKIYDGAGKLRRTFGLDPAAARQFTDADVAAAIDELLAAEPPRP
jgi:thiol-disulfide isomerase/thioredoxin